MDSGQFGLIDVLVLFAYLTLTALLGAFFYRGQETTEDYFLASRSMGFFPLALSIVATIFSAISYLGIPAFAYQNNCTYFLYGLTIPLVIPILLKTFLPFYHQLKIVSAYEYLERRFDGRMRSTASLLFLLLRGSYLAVAIYAPALVISLVTGFSLTSSILLMGGVTTFYTVLGGMKGVIWTDVLQFFVFFGAIFWIGFKILENIEGGASEFFRIASANDKFKLFDFSFDLWNDQSFWGLIVGGAFINLAAYGVDQIMLQRYLSARSIREGKLSLVYNGILVIPILVMLYLTGVGLSVFYNQHPELLGRIPTPDSILPYFAVHQLPAGLSGLVVAGIFAAAMSTFSSGINSLTTASFVDFYVRYLKPSTASEPDLKMARRLSLGWGATTTGLALFVGRLGGIFDASVKINSFFGGILLGVFLLGMFVRRANAAGAFGGVLVGIGLVMAITFGTRISFFWYSPIGCITTFGTGWLASLLTAPPAEQQITGLVMARRAVDRRLNEQFQSKKSWTVRGSQ
jgi:solute:Na+ symporter, SSS family